MTKIIETPETATLRDEVNTVAAILLRIEDGRDVRGTDVVEAMGDLIKAAGEVARNAVVAEHAFVARFDSYAGPATSEAAQLLKNFAEEDMQSDEDDDWDGAGIETAECHDCGETVLAGTLTISTGICEECDDEMNGTGAGQ